MATAANGDGTSESAHMADLAIDLADQLISAFQQVADGAGDGEGDEAGDDGTLYSDNGAGDEETDAKDGNDEWQELAEDDNFSDGDGYDNGVKGEGVGEENPASWVSPLGSHDYLPESETADTYNDVNNTDIEFTPARVLNFDDSDGDDLSAVDQRFIPRGVFVQSDFLVDRPELRGSEAVDYFSSPVRMNMMQGDHSQNVRIIEGHDDLELDRGAGYMSLTMRNNFLQTQIVQLPPLTAEDLNASANLYDSLEREEEELYPEDEDDHKVEEDDIGRDFIGGEDGSDPRDVHPLYPDGHLSEDDTSAPGSMHDGQYQPRALDRGDQGNGGAYDEVAAAEANSPSRSRPAQNAASPLSSHSREEEQPVQTDSSEAQTSAGQEVQNKAPALVVTLPNPSPTGSNLTLGAESQVDPEQTRQLSARPKQPTEKPQLRGGPAGSNGGGARNPGNNPSQRLNSILADQRAVAAGVSMRGGRSRVGVGSVRQVASGSQSQRPAVQGAAVAGISSGGDGDGAVANNSGFLAQGQGLGNPGGMLSSRTSSQGSIHSAASNNSNSRVSGVGKESNSNRNNLARTGRPFPASARPTGLSAAAGSRVMPPPPAPQPQSQRQQQQQPLPPTGMQPPARAPRQPPASKQQTTGVSKVRADSRAAQLQHQHKQLQQEQQQLQQKQRLLQQQQQQSQLGGMESPDGDHLVHHQPDAVVTQVGHMQQDTRQQDRAGGQAGASEVQGMEEVRSVLQSMLRLPRDNASFAEQRGFDFADSASDMLMDRHHFHHDAETSSLSGFRGHGQEEMPEMFDSFPSFSYKMFSDMSNMSAVSTSDRSMQSELVYLRECLEKERYRRKHCEQQIQSLNVKLLEIQQQLAVAVSTDKRKDIMIDQLDKQLAKVVEGWKKRETEKDEYLAMMTKEKSQIEETLQKQQSMIDSFEKELSSTVEELKQEKENSASLIDKMKSELEEAAHNQRHAKEMLAAEKERATLMEQEWDQLKESRDLAEKRAQQAQDRLHQEQDNWYGREQELLHKIDQVKEANLKVMQMERVKLEEQMKKAEDMEERAHTAQTAANRMEMELDSALREKESLKVEMALTEAKFESAHRALEADLHSHMEKKLADEVREVQERLREEQEEEEEKHRRLVTELHQRHQRDLESQMASLRQEVTRKENDLKQQLAEMENSLSEYRQENLALKQAKQKLESQRIEVLSKLQFIMQSQWNEAVSLLVSTPQRKMLNTSLSSSLASSMMAGAGAGGQTNSLNTSGLPNFCMTSVARPAAASSEASVARTASPRASQSEHRASSTDPPPFNNLSGSQSSIHSSPRTSPRPRTSSTDNTATFAPRSPFPSDSGVSLQDISALLSHSSYNPPAFSTANIHGVTHNGGLVVQTSLRGEESVPQRQQQQQQRQQQQRQQQEGQHQHRGPGSVGRKGSPGTQAVLIRPPQQLSRAGSTHDDFSFLSTSDLAQSDLSLLSQSKAHWSEHFLQREARGREDREGEGRRGQDRGLELCDLEVRSQGSQGSQAGLLMVNGGGFHSNGHGEAEMMGRSLPAYSPSLSPPVKQGRDGEQDSTDGDVLHENDRLNSSYREISRQLEEHQSRQRELQHYIRLLLEKPPEDQPERDSVGDPDAMEISFTSVAVDLGLTDAAQAAQMSTELHRLQQLRNRQLPTNQLSQSVPPRRGGRGGGVSKKTASSNHHPPSQSRAGAATSGNGGVLPPQQLAEISRLLSQYSEDIEASNASSGLGALQSADPASMALILNFLASMPQQQLGEEGVKSSSTKSSPKQQSHRTRDPHRTKRQADTRHHSVGPDTSTCSSGSGDKHDKVMGSSSRSNTSISRKTEKKAINDTPTVASSAKQTTRPYSKEQHPPVWK
ncbi:nucleoprotein TPR-like isoform X2 [Littorina saxatilis]